MSRTFRFTIWHGVIASLVLHSALAAPLVVHTFAPPLEDVPLVIELQGVEANRQTEEKVAQQSPEQQQNRPQAAPTPPREAPPPEPEEDAAKPREQQPQVAQQQPVPPQVRQVENPDEDKAQRLKTERELEAERLRDYVKRLAKKVKANLIYPEGATKLTGTPRVSLSLTADGHIRAGTLVIAESSGKPKLDASALATVRACAPFEPPPREMNVSFRVGYD